MARRGGLVQRVAGALRRRDEAVAGEEPPDEAAASDARSEPDTAARLDAARERLRGTIPAREED